MSSRLPLVVARLKVCVWFSRMVLFFFFSPRSTSGPTSGMEVLCRDRKVREVYAHHKRELKKQCSKYRNFAF